MRPLPALLALALVASACGDEPVDPAQTVAVPEADVERFRAEIFERTLELDADLARLETEASQADSVAQLAYAPVLDRLRADRRRLQVQLDSLRPAPPARFDTTRADLRGRTDRLAESVRRARYDAAPTYPALQAAVGRGLAELDAGLGRVRQRAALDTTGRLLRDADSLAVSRDRFRERFAAYPDTSAAQFGPFRQRATDAVLRLERRLDALATDTTRAARQPATDEAP